MLAYNSQSSSLGIGHIASTVDSRLIDANRRMLDCIEREPKIVADNGKTLFGTQCPGAVKLNFKLPTISPTRLVVRRSVGRSIALLALLDVLGDDREAPIGRVSARERS
jgi:hypothetical protein